MRDTREIRLRLLQRILGADEPSGGIVRKIKLISLVVALLGVSIISLLLVGIENRAFIPALIVVTLQSILVVLFLRTHWHDAITSRLILVLHVVFGAYTLLFADSIEIYVSLVPLFIVMSFVVTGSKEGVYWSLVMIALVGLAATLDYASDGVLPFDALHVIVSLFATLGVVLFVYVLDKVTALSARQIGAQRDQFYDANARYTTMINAVTDGLIVVGADGSMQFSNHAARQLLRYESVRLMGKKFIETIFLLNGRGEIIPKEKHPITQAFSEGERVTYGRAAKRTCSLVRSDRSTFPASIVFSPVVVEGVTNAVVVQFRDETPETQIDQAKNEFVSLASHQLRTPLTGMTWYIEKLLSGRSGALNDKQAEYLKEVLASSKRLAHLVSSLLNVSRIELGRLQIQCEDVEFKSLVESVIRELRPAMLQKSLTLAADYDKAGYPFVNSDKDHLTVVVQNLLSNAIKYTGTGGEITLAVKEVIGGSLLDEKHDITARGDGVILSIQDNGIGIPINEQERIFTKLYRARNTEEMSVEGTGLGLYVVKSLTEQLGGRVWFNSTPGIGTTFLVYLPSSGIAVLTHPGGDSMQETSATKPLPLNESPVRSRSARDDRPVRTSFEK